VAGALGRCDGDFDGVGEEDGEEDGMVGGTLGTADAVDGVTGPPGPSARGTGEAQPAATRERGRRTDPSRAERRMAGGLSISRLSFSAMRPPPGSFGPVR
jgi:hypothetical protein